MRGPHGTQQQQHRLPSVMECWFVSRGTKPNRACHSPAEAEESSPRPGSALSFLLCLRSLSCLVCALRGLGQCSSTDSFLSPSDRQSESVYSRESWIRNVPLIHGICKMYQQQECNKDPGVKGRADARCQGLCTCGKKMHHCILQF